MTRTDFDNTLMTPQIPEGQSPERTLYIDQLRAEIFGLNLSHETFLDDVVEVRDNRRARNRLRRKMRNRQN